MRFVLGLTVYRTGPQDARQTITPPLAGELVRESCSMRARSASSPGQRPEAPSKARKFVGELANVLGLALECPGSLIDRQAVRTARDEEIIRGSAQCPAGKVYALCCSDDWGVSHCLIPPLPTIYPGSLSDTA